MSSGLVLQNDEVLWFTGAYLSVILACVITLFDLTEPELEIIQSEFWGLDLCINDRYLRPIEKNSIYMRVYIGGQV